MRPRFHDRTDAGHQLAAMLPDYRGLADAIVLALPRGGVPVGYVVARELQLPLDVFIVRKLGLPVHEELAMGAIATGGVRVIDEEVVQAYGVTEEQIARVAAQEQVELERRERQYRGDRPAPEVHGRTVLLVDDGLATGSTMRVAVEALRAEHPGKIVVAVPIASPDTCDMMREIADDVVCAATPEPFHAVGLWYDDFSQTSDDEVHDLLGRARGA